MSEDEKQEKSFNLFSVVPNSTSTIDSTRGISLYQGRVCQSVYRDRAKLRLRREIWFRLLDLQPILAGGKLQGVRLLYRLGKWDGSSWTEERGLRDHNYGPFDTMSVLEEEVAFPVEDVDEYGKRRMRKVVLMVQVVALSQTAEHEKGKTIDMKLTVYPRL